MTERFPSIDYSDMIADLTDDIDSGFIGPDSRLYIVRQNSPIYIECCDRECRPVVDYFYDSPELMTALRRMSVKDAKQLCFDALEVTKDSAMNAAVAALISDLKDYTAGNGRRNERACSMVFANNPPVPLMVYFDDSDVADTLEEMSTEALLAELRESSGV